MFENEKIRFLLNFQIILNLLLEITILKGYY